MVSAIGDAQILEAWEQSVGLGRPWRELELLGAMTGTSSDELALLPLGERNRRLIDLRRELFGDTLQSEVDCPECGTRLELSLDAAAVAPPAREVGVDDLRLAADGWTVAFRLPNSADVAAAMTTDDPTTVIVERCVDEAAGPDGQIDPAKLPDVWRARVADQMEVLDNGADPGIDVACAECGHRWEAPFDPGTMLFQEVASHANRLMSEVDVLARAYGWREPDVLALSPLRRRQYLDFAG